MITFRSAFFFLFGAVISQTVFTMSTSTTTLCVAIVCLVATQVGGKS